MTIDPFADPTTASKGPAPDEFAQPSGGGDFPKPIDLFGCLLILEPGNVEQVPSFSDKTKMVDRLSATTHVVDGPDDAQEWVGQSFDDMYWSQGPIVKAGQAAKRKGQAMILGRLRRFPINEDKKAGKYQTAEDLEKALASAKPGQQIRFAWALEQYTPEDAQKAREYLAGRRN